MKKLDVKKFWREHKTTIIIGAISCVVGGTIGGVVARHPKGEAQELIKQFSQFNWDSSTGSTVFGDLLKAQEGSTHAEVFKAVDDVVLSDAGKMLIDWYSDLGYDMNSKVTGIAVFRNET